METMTDNKKFSKAQIEVWEWKRNLNNELMQVEPKHWLDFIKEKAKRNKEEFLFKKS